jgi:hypothetical protein
MSGKFAATGAVVVIDVSTVCGVRSQADMPTGRRSLNESNASDQRLEEPEMSRTHLWNHLHGSMQLDCSRR